MPRFYLNLYTGSGETIDEEGQQAADLEAARERALIEIRSLLAEEVRGGSLNLAGRIEVADQTGAVLAIVPFRDAVALASGEAVT